MKKSDFIRLFLLKLKFAASSVLATSVDYFLYLFLVSELLDPVFSNLISASIGMIINFVIQKRYIFQLKRNASLVFMISALVSVVGVLLGTLFIYLLNLISFFEDHQFITKAVVIGIIFNYNFYLKRFAFEKRFIPKNTETDA